MSVQPHPVAALLTDEMRERVRAATFERDRDGVSAQKQYERDDRRCPLAVAVGLGCSTRPYVYRALGIPEPHIDIESFMKWADSIYSDPADVYAMLGCDEVEP